MKNNRFPPAFHRRRRVPGGRPVFLVPAAQGRDPQVQADIKKALGYSAGDLWVLEQLGTEYLAHLGDDAEGLKY